jgi:hypothetical protein
MHNETLKDLLHRAVDAAESAGECRYFDEHGYPLCVAAHAVELLNPDALEILEQHEGDRILTLQAGWSVLGDIPKSAEVLVHKLQFTWDAGSWETELLPMGNRGFDSTVSPETRRERMHALINDWEG